MARPRYEAPTIVRGVPKKARRQRCMVCGSNDVTFEDDEWVTPEHACPGGCGTRIPQKTTRTPRTYQCAKCSYRWGKSTP